VHRLGKKLCKIEHAVVVPVQSVLAGALIFMRSRKSCLVTINEKSYMIEGLVLSGVSSEQALLRWVYIKEREISPGGIRPREQCAVQLMETKDDVGELIGRAVKVHVQVAHDDHVAKIHPFRFLGPLYDPVKERNKLTGAFVIAFSIQSMGVDPQEFNRIFAVSAADGERGAVRCADEREKSGVSVLAE